MTDNLRIERQQKLIDLKNIDREICDLKGSIERAEAFLDSLKYALRVTENRRAMLKLEIYSHVDEQGKIESKKGIHADAA